MLGSSLRRSGDQFGTGTDGVPVFPPGGVIPPRPVKYGTFACRYPYSVRNVMYCRGIQSNVKLVSHALNGSPGFAVKYGEPEIASAPLIGGSSVRYRPGLSIAPPPTVIAYRSRSNHTRS